LNLPILQSLGCVVLTIFTTTRHVLESHHDLFPFCKTLLRRLCTSARLMQLRFMFEKGALDLRVSTFRCPELASQLVALGNDRLHGRPQLLRMLLRNVESGFRRAERGAATLPPDWR